MIFCYVIVLFSSIGQLLVDDFPEVKILTIHFYFLTRASMVSSPGELSPLTLVRVPE